MSITAVITIEQRPRGNIEIALDEMNGSVEPLKREGNQKSGCANCAHHCALEPTSIQALMSLSHCVLLTHRSRFAGSDLPTTKPRWQANKLHINARPKNDKKGAQQLIRGHILEWRGELDRFIQCLPDHNVRHWFNPSRSQIGYETACDSRQLSMLG